MARALRVAIFGESYLPYLSGVTIATDVLARGLTEAGHRVLLVVPRPAGEPPARTPDGPDGFDERAGGRHRRRRATESPCPFPRGPCGKRAIFGPTSSTPSPRSSRA